MTVEKIANRLVEMCRANEWTSVYEELFSADAKGYEMEGIPDRVTEGLVALKAKTVGHTTNWKEIHEIVVTDPLVFANFFSVGMRIDVSHEDGTRNTAEEMCVYEVKDGKIIAERFFYSMG